MKPILFNTDMVRAILDNRKTVTRRAVKVRYNNTHLEMHTDKYGTRLIEMQNEEPGVTTIKNLDGTTTHSLLACIDKKPPFRPGDILYVRETFLQTPNGMYWYKADNICNGCTEKGFCMPHGVKYHTTCKICEYYDGYHNIKWRPSIHMPREAARIFLRVTDVRVERLQAINERGKSSAEAEGFTNDINLYDGTGKSAAKHFSELWDSTVKKAERVLYGWKANPWVWVIEFERVSKEEAYKPGTIQHRLMKEDWSRKNIDQIAKELQTTKKSIQSSLYHI